MTPEEISALEERIEANPKSRSFLQLAEAYIELGKTDQAQALLSKGVEYYPYYLAARITLGQVQMEKGLIPEAISNFEFVSRTIPDNLIAQKSLAQLYYKNNEMEKAKEAITVATSLSPDDPEILELSEKIKTPISSSTVVGEMDAAPSNNTLNREDLSETMGSSQDEASEQEFPIESIKPDPSEKYLPMEMEEPLPAEPIKDQTPDNDDMDMLELLPKTETMGDLFMEQKRYPQAEHIYSEVLKANPSNLQVAQKLALAKAHFPLSALITESAPAQHLIEEDVQGEEPIVEVESFPEPDLIENPAENIFDRPIEKQETPFQEPEKSPPASPVRTTSPIDRPQTSKQQIQRNRPITEDPEDLVNRIRQRLHRDVLDIIWASSDGLAITGNDRDGSVEENQIFAGEGVEFLRQITELGSALGKGEVQDGFIWMNEGILYFHDQGENGALFIWLHPNANVGRCRYIIGQEIGPHTGLHQTQ
ncbi:MAG: tetratricopeptide repeat protein [Leptospirillum sp.]|jgi:tetratricopeptide (TPR) repeat protein